jgi:Sel1 repeat
MFVKGEGVSASGARAAAPLAKACDAGIIASCGKLGVLFDSGNGVAPNKARAFALFNTACSRSDMTACYNQARLYESGQGTAYDVSQAAELYQRACSAEIGDGCSSVGAMYSRGVHFAQSEAQAEIYYKLGCSKRSNTGCLGAQAIAASREANRQLALATAENVRATKRGSSGEGQADERNPRDCLLEPKRERIIVPTRVEECDPVKCEWKDSTAINIGGFFSDGLKNTCSRNIRVVIKYDNEENIRRWGAVGKHIREDQVFVMEPGKSGYYPTYTDPVFSSVTWVK